MKNVCHNCPDRWVADGRSCHGSCEKYIQAKAEHEKQRAEKLADALANKDAEGVKRKSIDRIKKRSNRRLFKC